MEYIVGVCIAIDVLGAIGLLYMMQSEGQDAAGKAMLVLPILLLFALAIIAYFLLKSNHPNWALGVSGVPAIILIIVTIFTLKNA